MKRSLDVTCTGRDDNFWTLPQGNLEQLNWIWHLHQNYVVSFFKLCIELRLNWNTKAIKKTTEILSGEDHHGCILSLSISLYIYEHWLLHDEKRKQEHFISCVLEVNFCCLCSRLAYVTEFELVRSQSIAGVVRYCFNVLLWTSKD